MVAGDHEFGEKYHVAAALALEPRLRAVVVGPDKHFARAFLAQFDRERVESVEKESFTRSDYFETRYSTCIYCRKWLPGTGTQTQLAEMALGEVRAKAADVQTFLKARIGSDKAPAALLWVRNAKGRTKWRNTTERSIETLAKLARQEGLRPIPIGSSVGRWQSRTDNLIEFFENRSISMQLLILETLMQHHGACVSIGLKSGGMDGAGLFLGLPTISFFRPHDHSSWRVKLIERRILNFRVIPFSKPNRKVFQDHTDHELEQLQQLIQKRLRPSIQTKARNQSCEGQVNG